MDFQELRARFEDLWEKHASGALSDEEYLAQVERLIIRDDEGRWWTIGARTGKWYVSQGGVWVEAEPPIPAPPPPPEPIVEPPSQEAVEAILVGAQEEAPAAEEAPSEEPRGEAAEVAEAPAQAKEETPAIEVAEEGAPALAGPALEPSAAPEAPGEGGAAPDLIPCPACGRLIEAGSRFCGYCGAPIAQAQAPATCPQCGQPIEPGARFCVYCGAPLKEVPPSAPAVEPTLAARPVTPPPPPPTPGAPPSGLEPTMISGAPAAPVAKGPGMPPPPPPIASGYVPPMPSPPRPSGPVERAVRAKAGKPMALIIVLAVVGLILVCAGGVLAYSVISPSAPLSRQVARLIGRGEVTPTRPAITRVAPTLAPTATLPAALPATTTPTREPTAVATAASVTQAPATVTKTPLPPTNTPLPPTETPIPPTSTPLPPTHTPIPPTNTPVPPTKTPAPPTNTPVPPSPTPAPVAVLSSIPVSNGAFGEGVMWVEHLASIFVNGPDGHRYRAELGFLSTRTAKEEIQRLWTAAGRGGANWRTRIQVRDRVAWVACTPDRHACYDNLNTDSAQATFTFQVYLRDYVWQSLLNDYLAGGWQATVQNQYYSAVQEAIFTPLSGQKANAPCIGFTFTRAD